MKNTIQGQPKLLIPNDVGLSYSFIRFMKITCYLDVKVPFTKLKRRRWWIDSKKIRVENI